MAPGAGRSGPGRRKDSAPRDPHLGSRAAVTPRRVVRRPSAASRRARFWSARAMHR